MPLKPLTRSGRRCWSLLAKLGDRAFPPPGGARTQRTRFVHAACHVMTSQHISIVRIRPTTPAEKGGEFFLPPAAYMIKCLITCTYRKLLARCLSHAGAFYVTLVR